MGLFAGDQGKQHQPRSRPDGGHAARAILHDIARDRGPEPPGPAPGKQQHRQEHCQKPHRPVMGQPAGHPRRRLGPEQFLPVGGGAADQCRYQPQPHHGQPHRNRQRHPAQRLGPPWRIGGPEPHAQQQRHQMHEDHRALGIDTEPQHQAEPGPDARAARPLADAPQDPRAENGRQTEHRVEHRGTAIKRKNTEPRQDQRGAGADPGIVGPKTPRQPRRRIDRGHGKSGRDQARGEFMDARHLPDQVDQPEKQRRFMGVKVEVPRQVKQIPGQPELPCDIEIPGLVNRQKRAHRHHRHQRGREPGRDRQDRIAHEYPRGRSGFHGVLS